MALAVLDRLSSTTTPASGARMTKLWGISPPAHADRKLDRHIRLHEHPVWFEEVGSPLNADVLHAVGGNRRPISDLAGRCDVGKTAAASGNSETADQQYQDIFHDRERSEERRVGKECRSRWS